MNLSPSAQFAAVIALALPLAAAPAAVQAQDHLKVAIGQINNWENQAPTLGQDAGIFKKYNLVLENVGTQGAGETMQPVIAGSADLGAGVGVAGVMRAFAARYAVDQRFQEAGRQLHERMASRLKTLLKDRFGEIRRPDPETAVDYGLTFVLNNLEHLALMGTLNDPEMRTFSLELERAVLGYLGLND